ncbi:hypothetical protein [Pendulispora albinea]|uniref:Uncharacterized protein n=1 Tax=Pendulispora albinea TaxID=2741071 RepID=A0ABZ2M2E6_9BACT
MTAPSNVHWTGEFREEGELYFRVGRDGARFVAEWLGVCTLHADADGTGSELVPAPGADPMLVDKVHRGLARALVRHLEGKLTLHASASSFGEVAIACTGASQAGKSTLAAKLVAGHGGELVADDTLAVDLRDGAVIVHPTERLSWLLPDACRALGSIREDGLDERGSSDEDDGGLKYPVEPKRIAVGETRLAALVVLVFDDALSVPRLTRLRGLDAVKQLVASVVRFVLDEPERNRREMEQLARLSEAVPIYELARPRALEKLDATADVLRELARHRAGGA